jgi:hypothetical protein
MRREFQVRQQDEDSNEETVECFTSKRTAQTYYKSALKALHEEDWEHQTHIELVEVLEQDCVTVQHSDDGAV